MKDQCQSLEMIHVEIRVAKFRSSKQSDQKGYES